MPEHRNIFSLHLNKRHLLSLMRFVEIRTLKVDYFFLAIDGSFKIFFTRLHTSMSELINTNPSKRLFISPECAIFGMFGIFFDYLARETQMN